MLLAHHARLFLLLRDQVFVPEGFEGFLESVSDQKTERPHDVMPMRAAEPAKVVRIHYQIAEVSQKSHR